MYLFNYFLVQCVKHNTAGGVSYYLVTAEHAFASSLIMEPNSLYGGIG